MSDQQWKPITEVTLDLRDMDARKAIEQYALSIQPKNANLAGQLIASVNYFGGSSNATGDGIGAAPRRI